MDNKIYKLVNECEKEVKEQFDEINILCEKKQFESS